MQITLTAPYGMKMKLELPPERIPGFMQMIFQYASVQEPDAARTIPADLPAGQEPVKNRQKRSRAAYKGFLAIKCENCGEIRSFCTRSPISRSYCQCGHATNLHDLKPLVLECKCGSKYRYQTNMDEECFDLACLNCGNPVDLELNKHGDAYVTISDA